MNAIEIKNIDFSYSKLNIFNNFSCSINSNQLIGIVGSNGSGKSTLFKLILGLLKLSSGQISLLGQSPGSFETKNFLSSSFQEIDFPGTERVHEILKFVGHQYSNAVNSDELIKNFHLTEFANKFCLQLSGGMKRRLSLACAFAGQPKIVLLDEPTTGLDHASRINLIQSIRTYQQKNQALVLMISHYPQEITKYVDQFYHLKNGEIEFLSPERMESLTQLKKIRFNCSDSLNCLEEFKSAKLLSNYLFSADHHQYTLYSLKSDLLVRTLFERNTNLSNLEINALETQELIEGYL